MNEAQEVKRPKYILIVSQYYYSRHMLVVDANMDDAEYYEKARMLIDELQQYKRNDDKESRPFAYGDMAEKYYKGTQRRYNVNDAGDIYFIPCWSFQQALYEIKGYWEDSRTGRRGYVKKHITKAIGDHHDIFRIHSIIVKHFNAI